ncbi:MAG: C25 family cysteine peptidase [Bdellovibrionales bacterium]|nr:C25 family cysteine peptidase [Bdellovibrionales bacterium]
MKTQVLLVCFLLSFNSFAKIITFEKGPLLEQVPEIIYTPDALIFSHSLNSMHLKDLGEYEEVELKGLKLSDESHLARLPFYSFLVEAKAENINYELNTLVEESFTEVKLKPAPEMPCRCADDASPKQLNEGLYFSDNREMVEIEYLGDYRGKPISKVKVYAGKYSPNTKVLKIYSQLKVSFFSNEGPLKSFKGTDQVGKRYLFFTPKSFKSEVEELARYREIQGHQVQTFFLEDMGSNFTDIQSSIRSIWDEAPFDYALIVGHEEIFPTEYVDTSNDSQTPSDLNYFTYGGEGDFIPDVFYGRLAVDKGIEITNFIKKVKEFERAQYKDPSGLNKQIGIASNEGESPSDVEYLKQMQQPLTKQLGIHSKAFLQDNKNSTASNIVKELKNGAIWLNYIGHGSGNSWTSINRGEFHSDHIRDLESRVVKPIIIDVSCQNGRFNYNGRLGERFMNETRFSKPIGAVAYYGGSVDISWHPPAVMAVKISELFAKKQVGSLGNLLLSGQIELLRAYSNAEMAKENLVWYHLLGDPALRLKY